MKQTAGLRNVAGIGNLRAASRLMLATEGQSMKNLIAPILAATLAVSASTAFAGGPVMVEEETEVVAEKSGSSVGILPILLVTVALCAALCGGGDEQQAATVESDE